MNEATFWKDRLRPLLLRECRALGLRHHFERVENAVGVGDPDVDYCIDGVAGKMELKYVPKHPARLATPVLGRGKGMRRSQIVWAAKRLHAGGRVFLAIGTPAATWVIDLHGWKARDMKALDFATAPRLHEISAWCSFSGDPGRLPLTLGRRGPGAP